MTEEQFKKYLKERYEPQVEWYDSRAVRNKRLYNYLLASTIIFTALASILIAFGGEWEKWTALGLTAFVSFSTTFVITFRYHEKWVAYRTTCEALKKQIHYYYAKVGKYGTSADPRALFVRRCEMWISLDTTNPPPFDLSGI
ncbi:MAG: DUF4231 domain-containing protein [candidate division Zixibacteria bacterium]|nr:DUF4231 domain-containing protein [candidate division Zixibacteria bacterium]